MAPGIFSTNPTTPTALILDFLKARVFIRPTTVAEPAISYVISSINFAGLSEIPPVSKQTPFPTKANGFDLFLFPFHSIVTKYEPLILPWPTPSNALKPNFFNLFWSYTVTFNPNFLNLTILFAYSSGCKIFPGSETKSLVRKTPSKRAFNLFLNKFFCLTLLPTTLKFILISFFLSVL